MSVGGAVATEAGTLPQSEDNLKGVGICETDTRRRRRRHRWPSTASLWTHSRGRPRGGDLSLPARSRGVWLAPTSAAPTRPRPHVLGGALRCAPPRGEEVQGLIIDIASKVLWRRWCITYLHRRVQGRWTRIDDNRLVFLPIGDDDAAVYLYIRLGSREYRCSGAPVTLGVQDGGFMLAEQR
ncbi:hypothetical protein BJV74DRAFT_793630 [Russula compacta]|nr:hypothetical protein BJV74DRAFT_793630 [Russula compacta]